MTIIKNIFFKAHYIGMLITPYYGYYFQTLYGYIL